LLGNASDGALNKLGTPGAFYADLAIRILLPGTSGKLASKLMAAGDKLGLTSKLTKSLNDAAGLAALEAKPVFRKAVNGLTFADVPGIVAKSDGATQYLRSSVGDDLQARIRPLILSALTKVGAFDQLGKLGKSGGGLLGLVNINNDTLTDSVTKQALGGIFNYMGKEESGLRGNVLGIGKGLLDTIIK
ncbi:MAG: hypothetical protein RL367_1161, partial [Pseudomonadota bacterium]